MPLIWRGSVPWDGCVALPLGPSVGRPSTGKPRGVAGQRPSREARRRRRKAPSLGYCRPTWQHVTPWPRRQSSWPARSAPGDELDAAVKKLAQAGDRPALERAQTDLVGRIHERSDDFQSTAALSLVNKALAAVGWTDPFSWKHRRKP